MLDSKGFDLWADGYDKSVNLSEEGNVYPFAGYRCVLNRIYQQVRGREGAEVLDIGFGTGVLTTKLYNDGCRITGIDFSANMIDIARVKMPKARLMQWDFIKGLPGELEDSCFDFIISTYALHHMPDEDKVHFMKSLKKLLNKEGKILVGDVSFLTRQEFEECREQYREIWDDDEFYFTADEMTARLEDEYQCCYERVSHCAGVLTLAKL